MIIGLTGGIGSGKTVVSKVFEAMGCIIYNSDDRAKELYYNPELKKLIIQLLGAESYLSETEINKEYISKKLFSDTTILQQLNSIIHPAVKDDFKTFVSKFPSESLIIKETALLFEIGLNKEVDYSVLVTAPIDLKIERVMKRNALSKADIEKRMQAQWTDEQKIPLANFIIINDNHTALIPQVSSVIKQLKQHA